MDLIIENKIYQKHQLTQSDLIGILHLYVTGISVSRPYYPYPIEGCGLNIEIGFKNDHNGGLKIFDKIFSEQWNYATSSGLSRTFSFKNESEYNAFFIELLSFLVIGNYIANTKNDFCEKIYTEYRRTWS